MLSEKLLNELRQLSPPEKLRVVQVLVNDLAEVGTDQFLDRTQYEIWSPFDAPSAASALMKLLEDDQE